MEVKHGVAHAPGVVIAEGDIADCYPWIFHEGYDEWQLGSHYLHANRLCKDFFEEEGIMRELQNGIAVSCREAPWQSWKTWPRPLARRT